jgi:Zn-dependent protease
VDRGGLAFRILSFPVRARYSFFLVALVLGAGGRSSVGAVLVWVAVTFAAVLVHELGHALCARAFGFSPAIELHAMGGATSWLWTRRPRWFERLAASLAGPAMGFLAGGLVWLGLQGVFLAGSPRLVRLAVSDFLWVSIAWGVFNLVPILPMDGGAALQALLEGALGPTRAVLAARVVSCLAGVALAVAGMWAGLTWVSVLAALFTYDNFRALLGARPGGGTPRQRPGAAAAARFWS